MSEMVTVRTRKLRTCLPGKPRWIAGWQQTSAGARKQAWALSWNSWNFEMCPEMSWNWS